MLFCLPGEVHVPPSITKSGGVFKAHHVQLQGWTSERSSNEKIDWSEWKGRTRKTGSARVIEPTQKTRDGTVYTVKVSAPQPLLACWARPKLRIQATTNWCHASQGTILLDDKVSFPAHPREVPISLRQDLQRPYRDKGILLVDDSSTRRISHGLCSSGP